MAQVTPTTTAPFHPKHDIHKFRDIKPKLGRENWVSWKCKLLAIARDRGLYATVLGTDLIPVVTNTSITTTAGIACNGAIPLSQLIDEWKEWNNTAYNQIMLCISPELQTAIDGTDQAKDAWSIIIKKFESTDPSKISIVRTKYEIYHMVDGQSVVTYITTMKEFKNQLTTMGETIAESTHSVTILRNVPESWRPITQTIRMITRVPDEIEERLEAHEADLNALEISDQAATAFIARAKPNQPHHTKLHANVPQNVYANNPPNANVERAPFICNNCGKIGHLAARCYGIGGGLKGQAPWMRNNEPTNPTFARTPNTFASHIIAPPSPNAAPNTAWPAGQPLDDIIMVAKISEAKITLVDTIILSAGSAEPSSFEETKNIWLIDSAISSHISGNTDLFHSMHNIAPVKIDMANSESFTANQRGTIRIKIASDPRWEVPDVPITLTDVIYVPKLKSNLLSVGRMTNSDVSVYFGKYLSWMSL
jgi:gag-polypeptide of LTR copia-type/Pol polyprotein, beta-barrel domain